MAINATWEGPGFDGMAMHSPCRPVARLLASSGEVYQGFQYGNPMGVQFHPEVDHSIVRDWAMESPSVLQFEGADLDDFVKEVLHEEQGARQRLGALMEDVMHRCLD